MKFNIKQFFIFPLLITIFNGCVSTHVIPSRAKSSISYDEWCVLMNEAAWNLAGKSVESAQDSQIASYFLIFLAAMGSTTSTASSTSRSNVYVNGRYVGHIDTTTTITYNDPVKEAEKAATIAAGSLMAASNANYIRAVNDFLVESYVYYEESKSTLSYKEWLESSLKWDRIPEKNYDNNIYVDIFKPFAAFWNDFEAEVGYSYAGIPFFDIGGSLHFYGQEAYTEEGNYISGYSDGYPSYTWHSGYYEKINHPSYFAFSALLDTYLYTNRYNKGLYLKTSIGPFFHVSDEKTTTVDLMQAIRLPTTTPVYYFDPLLILIDFRQDLGYKLEFPVSRRPSSAKMYFSFELGYGMYNFISDSIYFDYGIKMGFTF
ncbi:hypothetical protein FACS189476_02670 [Spirochaetia bacterium]|nr:hypothetical protein FACS189476_02670 [Spirochaetia bacterium]